MINELEQKLISKFIVKAKQKRYVTFLSNKKSRHKFTEELLHFSDFNWNKFREIPGSENERAAVATKVNKYKTSTCYIISVDSEFDGKFVSVEAAVENVIGKEGTIIIFDDAKVIYYEGESPSCRYISI